jgi:hypothetical protein
MTEVKEFGYFRVEYTDNGKERAVLISREEEGTIPVALEVKTNGTACVKIIYAHGISSSELCTNEITARGWLWWLLDEAKFIDSVEKLLDFVEKLKGTMYQAVNEIVLKLISEEREEADSKGGEEEE